MAKQPRQVDAWWLTEAGIRGHYADERQAADAQHRERVKRINDDELAMLDAWHKLQK